MQAGIYQEYLNNWRTQKLRYVNNNANSLTRVSVEQLDTDNIFSRYSDLVLPDGGKTIEPKMLHLPVCVTFLKNISSCQCGHV